MKQKTRIIIYIAIAVTVLVSGILAVLSSSQGAAEKAQKFIDLGNKYLIELSYDKAVIEFNKAIEIEPKNADAYIGLAEAYIGLGDIDKAIECLERGYDLTGDERLRDALDELLASLDEEVTEVTTVATTEAETDSETEETTTTEAIDVEAEAIRAQALDFLAQFTPRKPFGEPNSILYMYVDQYEFRYKCFKCEYDENGELFKESNVVVPSWRTNFYDIICGNIITYTPYSAKHFERLDNYNYAILEGTSIPHDSTDDIFYWYDRLLSAEFINKSNNKYMFNHVYNNGTNCVISITMENDSIKKIECCYFENTENEYTLSLSYNYELSLWNITEDVKSLKLSSSNDINSYIGLPDGCDDSIFSIPDDKIEKTFDNYDEFENYTHNQ